MWCEDTGAIKGCSDSKEKTTEVHSDVFEVVDFNSESFYLNEDDDVSQIFITSQHVACSIESFGVA